MSNLLLNSDKRKVNTIYSFDGYMLTFKAILHDLVYGFKWLIVALFKRYTTQLNAKIVLHELEKFADRRSATISGGNVKLRFLYNVYERDHYRFNHVYLVSSCLPKYYLGLLFYCKIFSIKVFYNQNGTGYYAWSFEKTLFINLRLSIALSAATFVFYQSNYCKRATLEHLFLTSLFSKKPNHIVFNPVETTSLNEEVSEVVNTVDLHQKNVNLYVVGSHHEVERLIIPLKLIEKLSTTYDRYAFKLIIAGKIFHDLDSLISTYAPSTSSIIDILGAYDNKMVKDIYCSEGMLLHLKPFDPSPTVPIEAMSCGIPVISSSTGGMPEIIKASAGINIQVSPNCVNNQIPPLDFEPGFENLKLYYPTLEQLNTAVIQITENYSLYSSAAKNLSKTYSEITWLSKHFRVFNNYI